MNKAIAVPLIDFLWNMLLVFVGLFFLASFAKSAEEVAITNALELPVKYVITMEWDSDSKNDIDLFLRVPDGSVVHYANKEIPLINLERDDIGTETDIALDRLGKSHEYRINQEIIFIREALPGKYLVSPYYYAQKGIPIQPGPRQPVPEKILIKMIQLNPTYLELFSREVTVYQQYDEALAFSFIVDANKEIDFTTEEFLWIRDFRLTTNSQTSPAAPPTVFPGPGG